MLKLIGKVVILILLLILLFGCKAINTNNEKFINLNEKFINEVGNEIIRCIYESDKEGLNQLFCKKIRNTDYLYNQIDTFFNYLNDSSFSIGKGNWQNNGEHGTNNHGERVVSFVKWKFDKKILLREKEYFLYITAYVVLQGNKEYEGINSIYFLNVDDSLHTEDYEKINDIMNKNGIPYMEYLGLGIYDFDYTTYSYVNIFPEKIYKNSMFRVLIDDIEKGRSQW